MVSRRGLIVGLASFALGCSRRRCGNARRAFGDEDVNNTDVDMSQLRLHERTFSKEQGGPQKVTVLVPAWASSDNRLPLLIALHGRGEANRGLDVGAWAWVRDYGLDRTVVRLRTPPLISKDMLGIANNAHLDLVNESLQAQPWNGVIVACPHTTDILSGGDLDAATPFADFLADHLIPLVQAEFPVIETREATGIDGVSLGGRMALLAATKRPEVFGAVGTLQAAFRAHEVHEVTRRVRSAWLSHTHPGSLRILTSENDPFRPTLERLASELRSEPVLARYKVVPGQHDYDFNRGPGGYHMLLWHDRVLRGLQDGLQED